MGEIFNQKKQTPKRKVLRENMTKAETLLWIELKGKNIGGLKFRRQYSVEAYVVDFYCPALKLAIEIDGATHVTDEEIEYDRKRQEEIETMGIKFLRFTNEEIYEDLHNVLERVKLKVNELKM
jgi:very-short-patch-repair endonuclease